MLQFLPKPMRGLLAAILLIISTAIASGLLTLCMVPYALIPWSRSRHFWKNTAGKMPILWSYLNDSIYWLFMDLKISVNEDAFAELSPEGWYLLIANHQSWIDILLLYKIFRGKIPLLKFFMKRELLWVPFIGTGCWLLDFPFMYRYTKKFLQKHPEKAGKDFLATKRACEKFRSHPTTVVNFLEGTRFTPAKHARQQSPYQHLLIPKAGGIAYALAIMGDYLQKVINVTIVYHEPQQSLLSFLSTKRHRISVQITTQLIDKSWLGDYQNDPEFRKHFQKHVNAWWQTKDALLTDLKQRSTHE